MADKSPCPWIYDVVVPVVGPGPKTPLPAGKTLRDLLDDFQPDIAEWSILPGRKKLADTKVNLYSPDIAAAVVSAEMTDNGVAFAVPDLSVWAVAVVELR